MTSKAKSKPAVSKKRKKTHSPRVYRSMKEFKKEFLPVSYRKERLEKDSQDTENLGAILAQEHLEKIRRELRRLD